MLLSRLLLALSLWALPPSGCVSDQAQLLRAPAGPPSQRQSMASHG
jgi:hypothetical protein